MKPMAREIRRLAILALAAGLLLPSVTGCGRDGDSTEGVIRVGRLPDAYYGNWSFQSSSGGPGGTGDSSYRVERIAILDMNLFEVHLRDGTVSRSTFIPMVRKAIPSTSNVWMMEREKNNKIEVLRLDGDRQLTISGTGRGGFSYSFQRLDPQPSR